MCKNCVVPMCETCQSLGRAQDDCIGTYTTLTFRTLAALTNDLYMNEEEAEETSQDAVLDGEERNGRIPEQALSSKAAQECSADKAESVNIVDAVDDVKPTRRKTKKRKNSTSPMSSTASQKSIYLADQVSLSAKRTLDLEETFTAPSTSRGPVQTGNLGPLKRGRYHPASRIPKDQYRKKA